MRTVLFLFITLIAGSPLFCQEIFPVHLNGKEGLVNDRGELVIPSLYSDISDNGNPRAWPNYWESKRNYCFVLDSTNHFAVFNSKGKQLTSFIYDQVDDYHLFKKNMISVQIKKRIGIIDTSGKEIIPCIYNYIGDWFNNYLILSTDTGALKNFMIRDSTGKTITVGPYNSLGAVYDDYASVSLNGKHGFISYSGKILTPICMDEVGIQTYRIGEKWGLFSEKGKLVTKPIYDKIWYLSGDCIFYTVKGKFGLMDSTGRHLTKPVYDDGYGYEYGFPVGVKKNGKWAVMDKGLHLLTGYVFDEEWHIYPIYRTSFIILRKNGKRDLFDTRTKKNLLEGYDDIRDKDQLFFLKKDGKWGLADSTGRVIVKPFYDTIISVNGNKLIAAKEGKIGVADLQGTVIIPFEYKNPVNWLGLQTDEVIVLGKDRKSYVFDWNGKCIYDEGYPYYNVHPGTGRLIIYTEEPLE